MASGVQSLDELIMCLVGMGFEFDDCQEAVQAGKLAVQDAVDWILAGKPKPVPAATGGSSTLRLGPNSNAISNPFSNTGAPAPLPSPPTGPEGVPVDDNDAPSVLSRSHMSEEQRRIKTKFEDNQRDEARRQVQQDKLAKKRARELALKQIQEDRERQKLLKQTKESTSEGTSVGTTGGTSPSKATTLPSPTQSAKDDKEKMCSIQIRLPDGRALKQSVPADTALSQIWSTACDSYKKAQPRELCLMQPFPRKEYGPSDMDQSLADHGLTPSGSLVLKKLDNPPTVDEPMEESAAKSDTSDDDTEMVGPPGVPSGSFNPGHQWGSGHTLEGQSAQGGNPAGQNLGHDGEDIAEDGEDIAGGALHGAFPGAPPGALPAGFPGNLLAQFGGGGLQDMEQDWGMGQALNIQLPVAGQEHPPHHEKDPKALAAAAASERFSAPRPSSSSPPPRPAPTRPVPALTALSTARLSSRLADDARTSHTTGLSGLSSDLAGQVLSHLVRERLLRPKTLQPFINCHLKKLCLDSYPYVTNELLTVIRLHTSLTHLSLASCPLITDKGVLVLHSLKKLKHISFLGCKQLTDASFALLKELRNLTSVVLEGTSVTDEGLTNFCTEQPIPTALQHLNLNHTQVTGKILQGLKQLPGLRSLALEHTKLSSLSGAQDLTKLEFLNIAHTSVVTDSLLCLARHPSLRKLNISNTEAVNGDQALQYLSEWPLVELDLTNYINIKQDGFSLLGRITSLKRLRLGNTKITDEGLLYLESLCLLEELLLDRTVVTDIGLHVVNGNNFPNLQGLSLSETGLSNKFLKSRCLNSCTRLSKLNLSRTGVSDKGVLCISLPLLTLLNLDGTRVKEALASRLQLDPTAVLPSCRSLVRVSCNNRVPGHSSSDEDDDMKT